MQVMKPIEHVENMPSENNDKVIYKPGISIRNFLIIPFAILISTIIASLTYLSFQKGNDAVEQIKIKIRERTLVELKTRVSEYINTAHRLNKATENFISKGHLNINNPIALQDFFWNQLKVHENVNYIYFGYKDGGIVLIAKRTDGTFVVRQTDIVEGKFTPGVSKVYSLDIKGNRSKLIRTRSHFDSRTRPWFKAATNHRGPIWTQVYPFFLENALGITAALPLYNHEDKLLGVISTDILLTTFNKVLKQFKPGKHSEVFIVEKNGKLIASTADEQPFYEHQKKLIRIKADQSKSPVIKAAYSRYSNFIPEDKPKSSVAQSFDVNVEGKQHLVEIFPFKDQNGIDWLIGLTVSEQDILGPGKETLYLIIYLGIGALFLSVILCIILGQSLSFPLLRLQEVVANLSEGEKKTYARASSITELNSLASSFNTMADKVKQSVAELERKNADLNSEIKSRHLTEKKLRNLKDEIDIKQRTKLAGELHDNIGQSLQAINLGLKMIQKNNCDTEHQNVNLNQIIEEVGTAITQLRDIIERQRPIFLDQMDIVSALDHYGKKLSERAGCDFVLTTNVNSMNLKANIKEAIFLIFQEAINNTTKYANAKQIDMNINFKSDQELMISIKDDGIGFDINKTKCKQTGLGVSLMSERAESIGGNLDINSKPNTGTCITMKVPIHD